VETLLAELLLSLLTIAAGDWPAPAPALDDSARGAEIQRSLRLMAESTPQHRNTVRVLFYGSPSPKQPWWKTIADHLRQTYPPRRPADREQGESAASRRNCWVKTAEARSLSGLPRPGDLPRLRPPR